tara:strand:+ start:331 stop:555 length:225 start_codon:yes stop_codon:yes gene_type:complete
MRLEYGFLEAEQRFLVPKRRCVVSNLSIVGVRRSWTGGAVVAVVGVVGVVGVVVKVVVVGGGGVGGGAFVASWV